MARPDRLAQVHQWVSHHIVALIWIDEAKDGGDERAFALSGSLVSVSGRHFVLTAGHVLRDLDAVLDQRHLVHCDLYGNWGSEQTSDGKIAFNYPGAKRWCLYDEDKGYDYGL